MPRAFDWDGVMRACLASPARGGLGWTPEAFWRATPREVALALGHGRPMARGALDDLLARYPDRAAAHGGPDADCRTGGGDG